MSRTSQVLTSPMLCDCFFKSGAAYKSQALRTNVTHLFFGGTRLFISHGYQQCAIHFQSAVATYTDNVLQLIIATRTFQLLDLSCVLLLVPAQATTIVAVRFEPAGRFAGSVRNGCGRISCQEWFAGASEPGVSRSNRADRTGEANQATEAKPPSEMGRTELE